MQGIITYIRVHGKGNVDQLIVNGMVNEEFKRQSEKYWRYRRQMETKNSKLLKEKIDTLRATVATPCDRTFRDKAKDMRTFVLACIICFLQWAKLLVYDPIKEEREAK